MKIKFSAVYLLAFLSMLFLIHELHDWAHVFVAQWITGCWGTKAFDSWTFCDLHDISGNIGVLVLLAGPLITYIFIWVAWALLGSTNSSSKKSLGFSMLFASLPFARIFAAARGGSDETSALRQLFQNNDGSNRHIVSLAGLLLIGLLTVPALFRAFKTLHNAKEKWIVFPFFLVAPVLIDYFIMNGMNKLLAKGVLQENAAPGTPLLVILWAFFWLIIFMATYKKLLKLFRRSHHHRRKRTSDDPDIITE